MRTPLPPDDDPRFQQWIRDIGPLTGLTPLEDPPQKDRPVVAAMATTAAITGMGIAIGTAWCLVFRVVTPLTALVWIVACCGVAGFAIVYLVKQAS